MRSAVSCLPDARPARPPRGTRPCAASASAARKRVPTGPSSEPAAAPGIDDKAAATVARSAACAELAAPKARMASVSANMRLGRPRRLFGSTRVGACCVLKAGSGLAGGSPVPVGTGAPGSRPRFVVETRRAERGVKSLFGGSKCAGRSVKRTLQPRQTHNGRAEPLMSRRRPCPAGPVPGSARRVLSGVREAARAHSLVRNRRDPSAWPASGKDRGYKPMVKSCGGQRESEGVVVPLIGVQHNAPGGKGPNFDHACDVGKREGMTGCARSNYPGGRIACRSRRASRCGRRR